MRCGDHRAPTVTVLDAFPSAIARDGDRLWVALREP
jgi:hypothetical protein